MRMSDAELRRLRSALADDWRQSSISKAAYLRPHRIGAHHERCNGIEDTAKQTHRSKKWTLKMFFGHLLIGGAIIEIGISGRSLQGRTTSTIDVENLPIGFSLRL